MNTPWMWTPIKDPPRLFEFEDDDAECVRDWWIIDVITGGPIRRIRLPRREP